MPIKTYRKSPQPKQSLNHVLKTDFYSFLAKAFATNNPGTSFMPNWHIELIADYLKACEMGDIKRLIINIPPRHLKSMCINVAWPAWLLGQNPANRIISASYSQALATKHSLDTRIIINSPWYKQAFPASTLTHDQNEKDKFITQKRGFRLATSVGGTLTGEGGNFLLLDDPHNPAHIHSKTQRENVHNWYEQVFASRLDNREKGVIVLIMQRLHEDDLTGYLLNKSSTWEHLSIPYYHEQNNTYFFKNNISSNTKKPKSITLKKGETIMRKLATAKEIKNLKDEFGSFNFHAQYLQRPILEEGGLINRNWLQYFKALPTPSNSNSNTTPRIVQSWDTAIKSGAENDYSVCTTWAIIDNSYYLIDLFRGQLNYPDLKRKFSELSSQHNPQTILIEDKASGQSLIQDIKKTSRAPVIGINPKYDKLTRFALVSPYFESGKVLFDETAPWLADLQMELLSFPSSKNDDQVDSISQFLNWIKSREFVNPNIRRIL